MNSIRLEAHYQKSIFHRFESRVPRKSKRSDQKMNNNFESTFDFSCRNTHCTYYQVSPQCRCCWLLLIKSMAFLMRCFHKNTLTSDLTLTQTKNNPIFYVVRWVKLCSMRRHSHTNILWLSVFYDSINEKSRPNDTNTSAYNRMPSRYTSPSISHRLLLRRHRRTLKHSKLKFEYVWFVHVRAACEWKRFALFPRSIVR